VFDAATEKELVTMQKRLEVPKAKMRCQLQANQAWENSVKVTEIRNLCRSYDLSGITASL
jgi:hypothetical protein